MLLGIPEIVVGFWIGFALALLLHWATGVMARMMRRRFCGCTNEDALSDDTACMDWLSDQHVVVYFLGDRHLEYPLEHNPAAHKVWPGGFRQMVNDQRRAEGTKKIPHHKEQST